MKNFVGDEGKIVAVDGKAIRSTSKDGKPHSALQIITAYMTGYSGKKKFMRKRTKYST